MQNERLEALERRADLGKVRDIGKRHRDDYDGPQCPGDPESGDRQSAPEPQILKIRNVPADQPGSALKRDPNELSIEDGRSRQPAHEMLCNGGLSNSEGPVEDHDHAALTRPSKV